jgi:hypothetical protein
VCKGEVLVAPTATVAVLDSQLRVPEPVCQ